MARGFGLANSFWLEGPDGAVVVDTLDSLSGARKVMQGFRQVSDKKVKAIILTHHHQDHTDGTKVWYTTQQTRHIYPMLTNVGPTSHTVGQQWSNIG